MALKTIRKEKSFPNPFKTSHEFTPTRMVRSIKSDQQGGKDVEKLEPSYTVGRNVK